MKYSKKLKTERRIFARRLRQGLQGKKYKWRQSSSAELCTRCRLHPTHPVTLGDTYRGTRTEWFDKGRVGKIYHTDNLCLRHAAEEISKNGES